MTMPSDQEVRSDSELLEQEQKQSESDKKVEPELDIVKGSFLAYRVSKQVALIFSWIALGAFTELLGPSISDLKDQAQVNYEEISRILVARSIGYFLGSIFGGYICDRFNKLVDLFIAIALLIAGAATAVIPLFSAMELMGCMTFLTGVGQGILNAGGNTIVLRLWKKDAPAPMQSLHFGFGAGAIIAPQLLRPYLSRDKDILIPSNWTNVTYNILPLGLSPNTTGTRIPYAQVEQIMKVSGKFNFTALGIPLSNITVIYRQSSIAYPYLFTGIYTALLALTMFLFYLKGLPKGLPLFRQSAGAFKIVSPATCADGNLFFGSVILVLLLLYYIHIAALQKAFSRFLLAFAFESKLMSKDSATELVTGFWASFTVGRFVGIPVAKLLAPKYMIPFQTIMTTLCIGVVAIWGCTDADVLRYASWSFGLFQAPLFACGLAWANVYIDVTSMVVCVCLVGSALGGAIYQWVVGYFFEYYPLCQVMYLVASTGCVVFGAYVVMQCLASARGERVIAEVPSDDNEMAERITKRDVDEMNDFQLKPSLKRHE